MKDTAKSPVLTDIYKEILPCLPDVFRDTYRPSVCEITQTRPLERH